MITDRGLALASQFESETVNWQIALDCLRSPNLFEQGVAFAVFTSRVRDEIVPKIPESTDIPMFLFEHLLNCTKEDITPEQEEEYGGYVYDRGGAFLDRRVPLDPAWAKFNRELTEERYFGRLADFLKKHPNEYQNEVPTHVLEAWSPRQKPFCKIMKSWKADALLRAYVEDLENIFQITF